MDLEDVLDSDSPNPGNIESWFYGDDRARGEGGYGKAGRFVYLQAKSVTHPMKKSLPSPLMDLRRIALVEKPVS